MAGTTIKQKNQIRLEDLGWKVKESNPRTDTVFFTQNLFNKTVSDVNMTFDGVTYAG